MQVIVASPEIDGDTVTFRWKQSLPNAHQELNTFSFRYEGLDLAVYSDALWLEIFLGLQLGVWRLVPGAVTVHLPTPVPDASVAFWTAYHGAKRVTISPIIEGGASVWRTTPTIGSDRRRNVVFFGGGKDSLAATYLLSELDGVDQTAVVQYVIPRRRNPSHAERLERRQERWMLEPLRRTLGVATRRVWTDYLANMRGDGYRARPHAELYTLAGLPTLLDLGASFATICLSWTEYGFFSDERGRRIFLNSRSRPETMAAQSAHFRQTLGLDLTVTNLNLLFTGLTAMGLLVTRYPEGFRQVVSCVVEDAQQRWCYQCRKCSWYPFFALYWGRIDPEFDYDRLLTTSPHLLRMVAYAASGIELTPSGNAAIDPALQEDHVFPMFCEIMHRIDRRLLADRLSPEAYGNLLTIKAIFGNRPYYGFATIPADAVTLLDLDIARRAAALAGQHLPIAADLPAASLGDPDLWLKQPDRPEMTWDFRVRMPTTFSMRARRSCRPGLTSPGYTDELG